MRSISKSLDGRYYIQADIPKHVGWRFEVWSNNGFIGALNDNYNALKQYHERLEGLEKFILEHIGGIEKTTSLSIYYEENIPTLSLYLTRKFIPSMQTYYRDITIEVRRDFDEKDSDNEYKKVYELITQIKENGFYAKDFSIWYIGSSKNTVIDLSESEYEKLQTADMLPNCKRTLMH